MMPRSSRASLANRGPAADLAGDAQAAASTTAATGRRTNCKPSVSGVVVKLLIIVIA
jgi:hypothetical protein